MLSLKENEESLQVGLISKMTVTCRSSRSCQQTNSIFSSTTQRISTTLHMQGHKILLYLLIISVYILNALFLYKMFSNGHIMVTSWFFFVFQNCFTKLLNACFGRQLFSKFKHGRWEYIGKCVEQSMHKIS